MTHAPLPHIQTNHRPTHQNLNSGTLRANGLWSTRSSSSKPAYKPRAAPEGQEQQVIDGWMTPPSLLPTTGQSVSQPAAQPGLTTTPSSIPASESNDPQQHRRRRRPYCSPSHLPVLLFLAGGQHGPVGLGVQLSKHSKSSTKTPPPKARTPTQTGRERGCGHHHHHHRHRSQTCASSSSGAGRQAGAGTRGEPRVNGGSGRGRTYLW